MNILNLQNVYFRYNKKDKSFFLNNVNLSVTQGEFISILGPNGSGKSTLLKLISGILTPQNGIRLFRNLEYSKYSLIEMARKLAYVPQNIGNNFPFSVEEFIMMGRTPYLGLFGMEKPEDVEIVNEAMETVEVQHLKNYGINEISGGEAQRVFIARAIVQKPEILLLDEPSAHLDLHHQLGVYNLLKKLNQEQNITVIIVSHDLNLSGHYSSRALLMNSGELVLDDNISAVLTETVIKKYFNVDSQVQYYENNNNLSVLIKPDFF